MRWPWVSRRLYDAMVDLKAQQGNFLNAIIDGERQHMRAARDRFEHELTLERQQAAAALNTERMRSALEVDRLSEQLADERRRSEHLLDVVLAMRAAGGVVPRSVAPNQKFAQRRRSDIDQAIDENRLASANPRLRTHLSIWATKELAKGVPEATVLDRLRNWNVVRDDHDDDDDGDEDHTPIAIEAEDETLTEEEEAVAP
jgi:hypothetical protein